MGDQGENTTPIQIILDQGEITTPIQIIQDNKTSSVDDCAPEPWCVLGDIPYCPFWAENGRCFDGHTDYMFACCKRFCGLCNTSKSNEERIIMWQSRDNHSTNISQ